MLNSQLDRAIQQWEDARRLNPAFALIHRNLALAYARQPDGLPRAIASMETAVARDPQEPRFCLEFDQLCEAADVRLEKRLAFLEKSHAVVTKRDDTLAREIRLLVEVGRYERALDLLQGHQFHVWEGAGRTAVHNSFAEAHLALGHRHFDAGRYREALREYESALQYPVNLGTGRPLRGERLPETYYNLGRTCEALGDRETAAKHFVTAVETAPANLLQPRSASADDPELYYYAARALEKLGRTQDAARVCESLVEAGNARLADHLAMNFFASFGQSQSPAVRAAQAHYAVGLGLLGAGKTPEARQAFEQAAKLDANHSAARRQLRSKD
jgi:tetratricopeptide (TPR) repeat protein